MKTSRRNSRSQALQVLYQLDVQKSLGLSQGLEYFRAHFDTTGSERQFVEKLLVGVSNHVGEIDKIIAEAANHWRIDRMSMVDRNILRLGVFELCHCDDIPATVTINEMVELAKEFGEDQTKNFVNAILDRVRLTHPIAGKVE